jgi:hypothetical protein
MKHPMVRPSKPESLQLLIRIADEIPIREKQQLNDVPMEIARSPRSGPAFRRPRIRGGQWARKIYVSHIDVFGFQCYKKISRDETLGRYARGDVLSAEGPRCRLGCQLSIVRLSRGISGNILDFRAPQKPSSKNGRLGGIGGKARSEGQA